MGGIGLVFDSVIFIWVCVAWIACAVFCGHLAEQKRHCWPCWLAVGLLFGPIALIAAVGLPDKHVQLVSQVQPYEGEGKQEGFRPKQDSYGIGILTMTVVAIIAFFLLR